MTDYSERVKALRVCGSIRYGIRCISCPYNGKGCHAKLCTDAADAIEALQEEQEKTVTQIFGEEQKEWEEYCTGLMNRIRELKAQLPKRGEWVKGSDGLYHCSKCGKTAPYLDAFDGVIQYWEPLFFCNNCGADMRAKMEVQE